MAEWPLLFAMDSGVRPSFVARSIAAPFSSNSRAASMWPSKQAAYSGVVPLFARSTSAPFSSSSRTASIWPSPQAMYSGV